MLLRLSYRIMKFFPISLSIPTRKPLKIIFRNRQCEVYHLNILPALVLTQISKIIKPMQPAIHRLSSLLLCALLSACGSTFEYYKSYTIPDSGWTYNDSLQFVFEISDTSALYDITVNIQYHDTFPNQNFYTQIETKFPSGKRLGKVVSFDLFEKSGKPIGQCAANLCSLQSFLQKNAFFHEPGKYAITLHQFTRTEKLSGLSSIGLGLQKTGTKHH